MMNTLKKSLLAAFLFSTLAFTGCKDECKDVDCENGTCAEGVCICTDGYYGPDCSKAFNYNLEGTYVVAENCNISGNRNYYVTVAPKSGSVKEITLLGFYQEFDDLVTATVLSNGTSLTIPLQPLGTSGFQLEATTSANTIRNNGNTIVVNYTIKAASGGVLVESCIATLEKF